MTYRVMAIHDKHSSPEGDVFRIDDEGNLDIRLTSGQFVSGAIIGIPNFALLQAYVQQTAGAYIVDVEE